MCKSCFALNFFLKTSYWVSLRHPQLATRNLSKASKFVCPIFKHWTGHRYLCLSEHAIGRSATPGAHSFLGGRRSPEPPSSSSPIHVLWSQYMPARRVLQKTPNGLLSNVFYAHRDRQKLKHRPLPHHTPFAPPLSRVQVATDLPACANTLRQLSMPKVHDPIKFENVYWFNGLGLLILATRQNLNNFGFTNFGVSG